MKKIALLMTIIMTFFLMSCAVDPSDEDATNIEIMDKRFRQGGACVGRLFEFNH